MQLTFGDVEFALAETHDIANEKRPAFRARLQHLQKLKFPAGLNTGRGRAATYSAGHLYLLAVAIELLQIGLSPERAKKVIEDDLHCVAMAGYMAAAQPLTITKKFESPIFLYCDPTSLKEMMVDYNDGDFASQTFFYAGLGQVTEQFRDWFTHGVQRMAFFSVSAFLYDISMSLAARAGSREGFYKALMDWADPFIHNTTYPLDRPEQPYWNTIERFDD